MAFTVEEQKFFDFAKAAVPRFLFQQIRDEEVFGAFVKIMDAARQQIVAYFTQTLILQADGTGPDYLNQHALDRGTSRQSGEGDPALRDRLRNIPDALTRPALLAAMSAILTAEGLNPNGDMLEIRRDRAYFGSFVSDAGTGGEFVGVAPDMEFEPDVAFASPVEMDHTRSGAQANPDLVIAAATTPANDGTFPTTGLNLDAIEYQNAGGVAEVDGAATWSLVKKDVAGNVRDGFARAYMSRGYRMGQRALTLVLPFNCDAGTLASIQEMLRQKKGAGILNVSECMNGLDFPLSDTAMRTAMTKLTAGAGLPDSIYRFNQVSGSVADLVGFFVNLSIEFDLGPPVSPAQGIESKVWGARCISFPEGVLGRARAAVDTEHDITTGSFAILGSFRYPVAPAGPTSLFSKFGGGFGYAGVYDPVGDSIDILLNGAGGLETVSVAAGGGVSSFKDGKRHWFLLVRNTVAGDVNLYTTLGNAFNAADGSGDLTNTGIFSIGSDAVAATTGGEVVPYYSVFTGADAEILDTPTALSNYHESLGLGAL